MTDKFTSEDVDRFIMHWERKFPRAIRRVYRFWDILKKHDSDRLLGRILYEKNETAKGFDLACEIALKDYQQKHEFDMAVMDRLNELRARDQTSEFLCQIDGPGGA